MREYNNTYRPIKRGWYPGKDAVKCRHSKRFSPHVKGGDKNMQFRKPELSKTIVSNRN